MSLVQTTPPPPPDEWLGALKDHLQVYHEDDDALILDYLRAAVSLLDGERGLLSRALARQSYTLRLDRLQDNLYLPFAPVQSVDEVRFRDIQGAWQVLPESEWRAINLISENQAVRLCRAAGAWWPTTFAEPASVEIDFTAGYGPTYAAAPYQIRQLVFLLATSWYENRSYMQVGAALKPLDGPAFKGLVANCRFWVAV